MIFSSLKLHNIGLYKGENFFNLYPNKNKNIILFGGKNGAGKTTILESIKLCLYGNALYGFSKKKYQEFIEKTIHRGESNGHIELEFFYYTESSKDKYKILRKFDLSNKFFEEFLLYKNDDLLKDIPKEYWQDFIFDIIPPGLVNFFFFDGEKLEKLADDLTETELINDIKTLIGVTAIDELHANLSVIEKRYLKEEKFSDSIDSRLKNLENEKANLSKEISKLFQRKAQINQKKDVLDKKLKDVEKEFYAKGGKIFKEYEKLKAKRELLQNKITDIKNEIKLLSSNDLPLAVGLNLLKDLIKQLQLEQELKLINLEKEVLNSKLEEVLNLLKGIPLPQEKILELEELFSVKANIKGEIIHNLSDKEIYSINAIYTNLINQTIPKTKNLFNELEDLEEQLIQVEIALQTTPEEEILKPYLDKIKRLEEEKVKLLHEEKNVEIELKSLEENLKKVEKEIKKLEATISKKFKERRVIHLIDKSKKVLERFKKEFVKRKLSILRREVLEAMSKLERKEDFIVDLDINPETFEITLYDRYRRIIPLDKLSAGERQILAISFLWGLAKTSGRSLPVVIDTPLSRLDVDHRDNLVKNFYPNISHQVIILSTDAEIDKRLYSLMEEHISHAFHLVYDNNCMCTKVEEGYFWKDKDVLEVSNEIS